MDIANLSTLDFAGFIMSKKYEAIFKSDESLTDEDYTYGLRYSEFISLAILQIQKLTKRVSELENKIN